MSYEAYPMGPWRETSFKADILEHVFPLVFDQTTNLGLFVPERRSDIGRFSWHLLRTFPRASDRTKTDVGAIIPVSGTRLKIYNLI